MRADRRVNLALQARLFENPVQKCSGMFEILTLIPISIM